MEEKGLQEDPRYSQLLALRARQAPASVPGASAAAPGPGPGPGTAPSPAAQVPQLHRLNSIIYYLGTKLTTGL